MALGVLVWCCAGCAVFGPTAGDIRTKGTQFTRETSYLFGLISDKDDYKPVGKAVDWSTHGGWSSFKKRADEDQKLGINLYVAYSGPGLSKPLFKPNDGGAPYKDNTTLARNSKYWDEVDRRIEYLRDRGISVVVANTFVDQGILNRFTVETLTEDWKRTVKMYETESAMFFPLSEYDEHGNAGMSLGLRLVDVTRGETKAPVSLHPLKTNARHAGSVDFIVHQGWNPNQIRADLAHGKPLVVAEDQQAAGNPSLKIERFKQARSMGVTYIFTGNHDGWSSEEKAFLKSL